MHALNTKRPEPTARFSRMNTVKLSSSHQFNHNATVLHVDVVGRVDIDATAMLVCIGHSARWWWHVYREASVGANLPVSESLLWDCWVNSHRPVLDFNMSCG